MAKITSTVFDFDARGVNKALASHIYRAMKKIAPEIALEAKASHRYKNRTGNLTRSTKWWVRKAELRFAVYASQAMAPYSKYIIGGTRHWAPDPYIEAAFQRNQSYIDSELSKAVQQAIGEFNRKNRL